LRRSSPTALAKVGLPDAGELTPATDPRFGDYQTNAALVLGKQRGENSRALAEKIVARLDVADLCEPPAVAGAGFINFTLRPDAIAKKTSEILRDKRLGVAEAELNQRIVVDFGSPNVAKPMHVGHIRSIVLGDALARIAQFLGHEVIRDNHIGDWGTQFGMVIYGWKNLLDRQSLQRDPLAEIVRVYKDTNEATRDPQVREACRQIGELQAGDKENIDIWNECVAFNGDFEQIQARRSLRPQCGESFYNDRLPGVVERLLKSGVAEIARSGGCLLPR
jgi:arginyl-tRNA synthetase